MKNLNKLGLIALFFFGISAGTFAQEKIEWLKFEEAVAKNQENPKMILVDVYTDWCGWCKKMDKDTFTDSTVVAYVTEDFYPVKLNAEDMNRKFEFMGKEYSEAQMAAAMRVRSYPNFVLIDPTLQNITQIPGYRGPEDFMEALQYMAKNGFRGK
ncbi:thioredoxin family protein [Algoriphagus sediminis]|uniref:Thioredoxin fold domain-containing protein n=1 Tax=Algoriphagus sediminis TaxID=3057113 RepID=A0ABT7YCV1_9BACT|nr:thioredoxin fold domain-containing protein [Algoriphagus sediminis]MDN3204350.1 thioredoxin fold domain-containing protein [Algoriphagus sediminis]